MNGKGDRPRNCFSQQFRDNWERIFGVNLRVNLRDDLGGDGKSTGSGTPSCCGEVETDQAHTQDGGSTPPTSSDLQFGNSERVC